MIINKKDININYLIGAILTWILTVAWIAAIFYFSSENATDSSTRSSGILVLLEQFLGQDIMTETMVRKTAHILEFSVLTVLSFLSIRFTNKVSPSIAYSESPVKLIKSDNEMYIAISMWLSFLVAVADEYHQLFVDGRSGSMVDVAIDGIGIVIVLIIIRVIFSIYLKHLGAQEIRYE